MNSSPRARVRAFLEPRLGGRPLEDDDDIFALGYVNSLFAMQLARFVQTEFALTLEPADMDFDNFRTVNGIVRLVESKMQTRAAAM
jgi:methoxymalonate biosynthesis acyl carrier protein